jgi:hypothetical protein
MGSPSLYYVNNIIFFSFFVMFPVSSHPSNISEWTIFLWVMLLLYTCNYVSNLGVGFPVIYLYTHPHAKILASTEPEEDV